MIKKIKINSYKSLNMDDYLTLGNLTIISGINNIGKTTFLKSIMDICDYTQNDNTLISMPEFVPSLKGYQTKVFNNDLSKKIKFDYIISTSSNSYSQIVHEYSFDEGLKEGVLSYCEIKNVVDEEIESSLKLSRKDSSDRFDVVAYDILNPYYVKIRPEMIDKLPEYFIGKADFVFLKSLPLEGYFYLEDNPKLNDFFELSEDTERVTFGVSKKVEKIMLNISAIKYLEPLRSHPKEYYHLLGGETTMSSDGGNAIDILVKFSNKKVSYYDSLKNETLMETTLSDGVDYWFKYFFNEIDFDVKHVVENVLIQIMINGFSINNSGFGISQILPIIIQGLLLEKNELFILEQPEIHLHPELEMKLANFLLCLSRNNRQIIAETHSEHIINQIILEKMDNEKISDLFKIYFFDKEHGYAKFRQIEIGERGEIKNWPKGFFDQYMNFTKEVMRKRVKNC